MSKYAKPAQQMFLIDTEEGELPFEVSLRTFDQRRSLCPRRLREIPQQVVGDKRS